MAETERFERSDLVTQASSLAGKCLRPLGHVSMYGLPGSSRTIYLLVRSQSLCPSELRGVNGSPGANRTRDPRFRRPVLLSTELRARWRKREDSDLRGGFPPHRFRGGPNRPTLAHFLVLLTPIGLQAAPSSPLRAAPCGPSGDRLLDRPAVGRCGSCRHACRIQPGAGAHRHDHDQSVHPSRRGPEPQASSALSCDSDAVISPRPWPRCRSVGDA